jgi:putative RNA 2'-phosphotransferase
MLLKGLRENIKEYQNLALDDIFNAVNCSQKKRHEIKNYSIRALYGHSTEIEMSYTEHVPPQVLYHGTSDESSKLILSEGLKPMQRKYVHLSSDARSAIVVGSRKELYPIILSVDAEKAYGNGIIFYFANGDTWLTKFIPSKFIEKVAL